MADKLFITIKIISTHFLFGKEAYEETIVLVDPKEILAFEFYHYHGTRGTVDIGCNIRLKNRNEPYHITDPECINLLWNETKAGRDMVNLAVLDSDLETFKRMLDIKLLQHRGIKNGKVEPEEEKKK